MLIIDLAVPRDTDEEIGFIQGVELYNINNIESNINQNINKRRSALKQAGKIIKQEVNKYLNEQSKWYN